MAVVSVGIVLGPVDVSGAYHSGELGRLTPKSACGSKHFTKPLCVSFIGLHSCGLLELMIDGRHTSNEP